jgi:prefoldin subunit 2
MSAVLDETNPEAIIGHFKQMNSECQQIQAKVTELTLEKEEHRLVEGTLSKLDGSRKAYRLVGGILVERTVGEVLPIVSQNLSGVSEKKCWILRCVMQYMMQYML